MKNAEKYDIIYPREVVTSMVMVYLIFALSIFFVRLLAGYDSRYQKGKYISINNTVLRIVLLDSMSIYGRTRRLKKDENKMSFCGIPFYLGIGIVLLTNIVFLIIPDIPIEPWGIETNKFIVYANTLNDALPKRRKQKGQLFDLLFRELDALVRHELALLDQFAVPAQGFVRRELRGAGFGFSHFFHWLL